MKQVQYSDRQSDFIFYLVHHGRGRKVKRLQLQRILHLSDKGICSISRVIVHIKTVFYLGQSETPPTHPAIPKRVQTY